LIKSSPKCQKKHERIKKCTKELFAEDMGLHALRKALKLTQKNLAKKLSIGQEGVSRLQQRSDLILSTLRSHTEAMGGKLRITAECPNHTPVNLSGFSNPTKHR
jgi:DNA-binding transcriptional regulator YiaG